jgi:hypothetical protein
MKKSEIPVEGFYILAYLVLMSLAGATLYFYIEAQSLGPNYRISAASIIEESESIKKLIDQERLFVLETVMFFLGSQGGVDQIDEYNAYNESKATKDSATNTCLENLKSLNSGLFPSKEITSRCITNKNFYYNPESLGVWKCDDKTRYYTTCEDIANYGKCCESVSSGKGYNCHEACLLALGFNTSKCYDKTFCGALWCKEDNLEIPETFQGVQYYYKISQKHPGYFCPSPLSYNPEQYYGPGEFWKGLDSNLIIKNLIDLSNKYFYLLNPNFRSYISSVYQKDLKIAFQLNYKGCSKTSCEFSWVPYGEVSQDFEITGLGGIPMVKMSSDVLSLQSINIPLLDMIDYSKEIIKGRKIEDFFSNTLKDNVLVKVDTTSLPINIIPQDWVNHFSKFLGTNDYGGLYDDSNCGLDYMTNNDYGCLMQHVSTKLYSTISTPMQSNRESGINFNLRPVFNFVISSLGASIKVMDCGNNICDYGETWLSCPTDCDWEQIIPNNINCDYTYPTRIRDICNKFYTYNNDETECKLNLDVSDYIIVQDAIDLNKKPCNDEDNIELQNFYANKDVSYSENYDPNIANSEDNDRCIYLLLARDCEKSFCGDGVCDFGEDYYDCAQDCGNLRLFCGDGIMSNNEDCLSETSSESQTYSVMLDSGKYSVFVKGSGNTTANIEIINGLVTLDYSIDVKSNNEYYTQATIYDDKIGKCAYNTYSSGKTLTNYESFGCCPLENYTANGCQVAISTNAYCTQINNKYGRSQIGSYCNLNNIINGKVDYDINSFDLNTVTTIHVKVKNLIGAIDSIDIIRVQYDNTFNVTSRLINGKNMNYGGSYEYYSTTKDCSSAVGPAAKNYDSFTKNELWYSMLCLRSKGINWINIIENYTLLFNNFKTELGDAERGKIDNFIKKYKITLTVANGQVLVKFTNACPSGGCVSQLKGEEIFYNYEVTQSFQTYADNELIKNRIIEIQSTTDYLSLPIKWVFAYNDKVRIDSSNSELKDNSECDLVYDIDKKPAPDCGCKSDCIKEVMCNFDFSTLSIPSLLGELYSFKTIFIDTKAYRDNGVVSLG